MYKCNCCGNTVHDDFIVNEHDIECRECNAKFSEGEIAEIHSEFGFVETSIMTEVIEYCLHECCNSDECKEYECVLFRIEKIIENNN